MLIQQIIKEILGNDQKIGTKQIQLMLDKPIVDRCLGSLFGGFIGDALGSHCEFEGMQSQGRMQKVMSMPGGGPFQLQPGQITDDNEMSMHMLKALLTYNPQIQYNQQTRQLSLAIAQQYVAWRSTNPFDIGITTNNAILCLKQQLSASSKQQSVNDRFNRLNKAYSKINKINGQSLSNGFLMRASPLICFHALLIKYKKASYQQIKALIENEIKLTHSHPIAIDSSIQWVQMISKIINRSQHQLNNNNLQQLNQIFNEFINKQNSVKLIKQDILKHIKERDPILATQQIGYFKHAYHFAIYQMKAIQRMQANKIDCAKLNSNYFKNSIKFVIKQGGDTDTNACIVGSFLGAILGFKNLPSQFVAKQLTLKLNPNNRQGFHQFYQPKTGFINMIRLIRKFI